jgi:hypothetical protein
MYSEIGGKLLLERQDIDKRSKERRICTDIPLVVTLVVEGVVVVPTHVVSVETLQPMA